MEVIVRKIKMPTGLQLQLDDDVKLVMEFILINIKPSKRIKVANAVQQLSPVLFGEYINGDSFQPLYFSALNI